MQISGKIAVVTGGASGIGRAIATELLARGAKVVIADIDGARAALVAAELGGGAVGVACDVADRASVEALADATESSFGPADLVFANAGVSVSGPLIDATPQALDWIFGVNVRGTWNTAAVFARRMRDTESAGHICLTGSEHSIGMQSAGMGLYTATKQAVLGMADVLRAELPANIGVSILCPGLVETELHLSKRHGPLEQDDAAAQAFGGAIMARGMPAAGIGRAAVEGVARGDFLIVTHATALAAAEARHAEVLAAFAAQAPMTAEAARYAIDQIIADVGAQWAARGAAEAGQ
ncbi:SDR family oxidoreductase [Polymorphobacter arshaanensis]|uniref:SDR family oxidoreductase n=1 Tax=Glacieibacterium arshaanense TaxID=2511025 RepID=A0A4Y9EPB8_9SPHN|nr:SDR family oxidoreductase [Polymorphobacter arshaanensis]TFU05484.1 SDR family oxidoreductase [Polymorphobacter arshaanensis]